LGSISYPFDAEEGEAMKIFKTNQDDPVPVTILHIEGDVDANSAGGLQKEAREAYDAGSRNLLLDMSDVTFLSSSGLRAIHQIFMMMRDETPAEGDEAVRQGISAGTYKSLHLKLLNPSTSVQQVLKISGFDMFLEIYHDLRKALASFS
jgi:anti-anti-sigma factor